MHFDTKNTLKNNHNYTPKREKPITTCSKLHALKKQSEKTSD